MLDNSPKTDIQVQNHKMNSQNELVLQKGRKFKLYGIPSWEIFFSNDLQHFTFSFFLCIDRNFANVINVIICLKKK